jgi:hypothetical protein
MTTLPFDCYRCEPEYPTEKCTECLRWKYMEGQTFGPRTPIMSVESPDTDGCNFVAKYEGEKS